MDIDAIKALAESKGWQFIDHQEPNRMLSFYKLIGGKGARINVYYSTMTVGTAIHHPKKGRTQLFRKHVDKDQLIQIFTNPRIHTDKGYY